MPKEKTSRGKTFGGSHPDITGGQSRACSQGDIESPHTRGCCVVIWFDASRMGHTVLSLETGLAKIAKSPMGDFKAGLLPWHGKQPAGTRETQKASAAFRAGRNPLSSRGLNEGTHHRFPRETRRLVLR